MRDVSQKKSRLKYQKGSTLFLFCILTTMLFGFTAISVDVGHLFLVRAELEKAAEAASLAGASYLYPTSDDGNPNWDLAAEKAIEAISWNSSDGTVLSSGVVETGYWDLTGENPGLRAPDSVTDPGEDDIPSVRVLIARSSGQNGGPVPLYLGSFIGVNSKDVNAESVAGAGSPRAVEEGTLFPVVLPSHLYNDYWDFSSQKPQIDPATGEPYVFDITADGSNGQWTSFDESLHDVTNVQEFMESGNPNPLSIGQEVYIVEGMKASLYNSVPSDIDVTVAILSDTIIDGAREIIGFGAMHIHYATGANTKSITVSLMENHKTNGGTIGGYYYGTYAPPKLVH